MQGPRLQHRALLDSLRLSDKGAHLELLELNTQVGQTLLWLLFFFCLSELNVGPDVRYDIQPTFSFSFGLSRQMFARATFLMIVSVNVH